MQGNNHIFSSYHGVKSVTMKQQRQKQMYLFW